MRKASKNLLLIATIAIAAFSFSCSDDGEGVERLPWNETKIQGTWSLDTVLINNAGNDSINGMSVQRFKQAREGSTVVFDGANMTMTKGGSQVMNRTYTIRNFYIKLGTTDFATDTLQLQNLERSNMNWVKLRQYTDHTHRHYLVYHLNRR